MARLLLKLGVRFPPGASSLPRVAASLPRSQRVTWLELRVLARRCEGGVAGSERLVVRGDTFASGRDGGPRERVGLCGNRARRGCKAGRGVVTADQARANDEQLAQHAPRV